MHKLTNISQLYRVPADGGLSEVDAVANAAVVWDDGRICYAGPESELPDGFSAASEADAGGCCVVPGLIDCHTHLCFGGWRGDEFAARLEGASYQDIQAGGGGIHSTVQATRSATEAALAQKASTVLADMARLGVTTVEAKSGYGLNRADELKQLEVYRQLGQSQPLEIIPTFLGAHLVPAEYRDRRADYLALLCNELIPEVAERRLARLRRLHRGQRLYARGRPAHSGNGQGAWPGPENSRGPAFGRRRRRAGCRTRRFLGRTS